MGLELLERKLNYCLWWTTCTGLYRSGAKKHHPAMQWSSESQSWKPGFAKQNVTPILLSQLLNDADLVSTVFPELCWFSQHLLPPTIFWFLSSKRDHELGNVILFQNLLSMDRLVSSLMTHSSSALIFMIQERKSLRRKKKNRETSSPSGAPRAACSPVVSPYPWSWGRQYNHNLADVRGTERKAIFHISFRTNYLK